MQSSSDIQFVYFDLGNVLLSFDPDRACRNMADRFDLSEDQARRAVYQSGLQNRFEHGELSPESFADSVRQQLGRVASEMPTPSVLDAISDMFTPIDSMRDVLRQVRQCGIRIGLLSNTCFAHWDWISRQRYAVMDFAFDVTILSFEVGSMKPGDAIYIAAEQAAGVASNKILFLDDKPENVQAAAARDWHAVQCFGGDEAISALTSLQLLGRSH